MKRIVLLFLLLAAGSLHAQDEILANGYFERGEFEKALLTYQKLYEQSKNNTYFEKIVESLQQLERYDESEKLLMQRLTKQNYPPVMVELGYNYQLKGDQNSADDYYNKAIARVDENPSYSFGIARRFEDYSLLEYALEVYKKGMALNPDYNFSLQMARIYGEQGNIEQLFSSYLDYLELNPSFLGNAKRAFSDFVSENKENENNRILRVLLLKELQAQPDVYWYDLLSWLFIQQKEYNKAFTQEKALYKRNPESLRRIIDLALTSLTANDDETAIAIFNYILENSQDIQTVLLAHQYLLDLEVENADIKTLESVDAKYQALIEQYGINEQTLGLQIGYGNFLAFYNDQPEAASQFLKESLSLPLSVYEEAEIKMKLADILVYQERFNEALIYYSQIQANVKNSSISQEARFKVAKTSYYKGDFDWAESQLKILKASTSQLIANDALELKLLISDNKDEDSLQTALKLYAKADLMSFQNKNERGITLLNKILTEHKGESIEDQALYMQAKLFEKTNQLEKAVANYEYIIANYRDEILADDAYFYLAELYETQLAQPEKAKDLYEKIIFNHQDSIYFVEARKRFRMLRGDAIN
ncbi:tetratricopeptide repeat protein [Subsaximicrobium wynnwilliamsii]|uniref:Tetratricopeptide repeat protein n=1 Tax=Subsaximicrobium wynnwilliamsii TaxID=291179 RepID=A0A5C6ZDA4_9FLAO|nr:tetratricopeptide repeat protein [Subsaximicrobium wynnwilliamsii]TXD81919.1 tetratricopeptide repeat protein [Subsaximicrobium wynnwilliamsii]TXD87038.1 tetratricopeptide repeat protein [Subsaximicrobium wynnwilliamsii]TXE01370.1 tetratricopeptide repeat protein [Subsaximicrobium wynnwilliamsii]